MGDPVLDALERDEAYAVVKVLSSKPSGTTELVSEAGSLGFYVRKRIPIEIANREAWEQLAFISDSRLPRVIEMYELPDTFVAVCEYVEGFSLDQLVSAQGKLVPAQAFSLLEGVCSAADVLHEHGIVHRDISPTNVIVAGDGAHLIDLGIARVGEVGVRHDTTKLGTWGFAAPEQYGFAQTDARSDVYSIGCLAAYMLTGIRPDEEGFDAALDGLATPTRAAIDRARAFEPSARFASATEFLSEVSGSDASARLKRFRRRNALSAVRALYIPPRELRAAWNTSSLLRKAVVVVSLPCWLSLCGGMFSAIGEIDPSTPLGWVVVEEIMMFLLALCISWIGIDGLLAVLGAGSYRIKRGRIALWGRRALLSFAIVVAAVFVMMFVATLILGRYPNS